MLVGIKLQAHPAEQQKLILSQWMGCARFIWNAKVTEEKYYSTFARKYYPIGTYAPIDKKAAQFKSKELTPWLSKCPSQIIRNSATNWHETYSKFLKGICGKPKIKPKTDKGSIYLTREVFRFEKCADGNLRLFIGTKTNNIGYLSLKIHNSFAIPNSIHIRKECGKYYVSFCYENNVSKDALCDNEDHLAYLKGSSREFLEEYTCGIDRGVAIPVHAGFKTFDYSKAQKKHLSKSERYIKRYQRRLAKQQKGSNRRNKTKFKLSKRYGKMGNIRNDFAHKTSRSLVDSKFKIFVLEDLKTKNMTRKPKPKQDENGKFISNKAAQKAGLNKAILNVGWYKIALYTQYKAYQSGKAVFKISPYLTSQECSCCGNTQPDNRKSQALFVCCKCGYVDNADNNASKVIKDRAINLILNSGTELSEKDVLTSDTGRGGKVRRTKGKSLVCNAKETPKKKSATATAV